jgi:hypothetical protein
LDIGLLANNGWVDGYEIDVRVLVFFDVRVLVF